MKVRNINGQVSKANSRQNVGNQKQNSSRPAFGMKLVLADAAKAKKTIMEGAGTLDFNGTFAISELKSVMDKWNRIFNSNSFDIADNKKFIPDYDSAIMKLDLYDTPEGGYIKVGEQEPVPCIARDYNNSLEAYENHPVSVDEILFSFDVHTPGTNSHSIGRQIIDASVSSELKRLAEPAKLKSVETKPKVISEQKVAEAARVANAVGDKFDATFAD